MNTDVKLTKRETEIAELVAWGASKCEIAARCYISERTVENHCRNIFEKVGVTKATELSAWWFCTSFHISFELSPLKTQSLGNSLHCVAYAGNPSWHDNAIRKNEDTDNKRVQSKKGKKERAGHRNIRFGFINN